MGICGSSSDVVGGNNRVFCIAGPPGSVKTKLCEKLKKDHGYGYVTLGEAQRRCIRKSEELGQTVKQAMQDKVDSDKEARKTNTAVSTGWAGDDNLNADVLAWLFTDSDQSEAENGWLLDGYPVTKAQVKLLKTKGIVIEKVVIITVDDETLIKLATGRRMDTEKQVIYHVDGWGGYEKLPEDPAVQERVLIRDDDNEETVKGRLEEYKSTYGAIHKLFGEKYELDGKVDPVRESNREQASTVCARRSQLPNAKLDTEKSQTGLERRVRAGGVAH